MAVVTTLSPSITSLDAIPPFRLPTGEGAPGLLRNQNDSVTANTTDSIGSVYKLLRLPTNAKIKHLFLASSVATAGAADVDVAFSDNASDGTPFLLATAATPIIQISAADNKLFGAANSLISAAGTTITEITFKGTFTQAHQNLPLWAVLVALGASDPRGGLLTTDPGGFFDIVAKITTSPSVAGIVGLLAEFVE